MHKGFLRLYENCVLVKGAKRSLICDLQNEVSYYVPNDIAEAVEALKHHPIEETISKMLVPDNILTRTVEFVLSNKLGHVLAKKAIASFPPLSLEWDYPAEITNCIIDLNRKSDFDFHRIFLELEGLGCQDLQLRIYEDFSILEIENVLIHAEMRMVKNIQLFVANNVNIRDDEYLDLVTRYPRITALFIYGSKKSEILTPDTVPAYTVARIAEAIDFKKSCGMVHPEWFVTTMEHFTESQKFNTCLNRKISIDEAGTIRNCPSIGKAFGNIRDVSLPEVIDMKDFRKLWDFSKSKISVCNVCEFRHICTDCRVFLEDPENINSKPLKCGYDPYTTQWSEWSENPLKEIAREFYRLDKN